MDSFYAKLKEVLQLPEGDEILNLVKLSSGWYLIKRKADLKSRRYNLAYKKIGFSQLITIHDWKLNKNYSFNWTPDLNLESTTEALPKKVLNFDSFFEKPKIKDTTYLKSKGLHTFDLESYTLTSIGDKLAIPYTSFEAYPMIVGVKLISPDGTKSAIKGSTFKNSFHAHRYSGTNTTFIIGEGLPECCVATSALESFNVLEIGSISNLKNILQTINKISDAVVYVMAEHGSEKIYDQLALEYSNFFFTYPPDKLTKDFGDYYLKYNLEKAKEAILGLLLEQTTLGYKPLGIEGTKSVFYSKIVNDIIKRNPEEQDIIYRLACRDPWNAHKATKKTKQQLATKVFMECAQCGTYIPNNVLPVGLWTFQEQPYYNDGTKVLKVLPDKLITKSYSSVLQSNFLVHKVSGAKPLAAFEDFNSMQELEDLFDLVHWEDPISSKLVLGFLIQSFYAGSINFRPHIWLMSDTSHAGKSWFTHWCADNLVTNSFSRESGRSTTAGTAQAMAKLAGLLTCDEFAEKDSSYMGDARKMIELLRSASTANAPIVVGSPEQKPILGHCKFSAFLACIEGEDLLKKQDMDRIIILRLIKKSKDHFEKTSLPLFKKFLKEGKHKGFPAHALKNYYLYQKHFNKIHVQLTGEMPHIGHKARGLASIIAGYAAFKKSSKVIEPFIQELRTSEILKYYAIRREVVLEAKEDIIERVLRIVITDKFVFTGDSSIKTVVQILKNEFNRNAIIPLGLKLHEKRLRIYCTEFRNFNERFLKMNISHVYKKFSESRYFSRISNSYFNGKKSRYFEFDLTEYLKE